MAGPVNPYVAGNPVGSGPAFVGRDDVLRAVLRALADPERHGIVLYGQRRIGKTSILQHLQAWLPEAGGPRAIYFDLQDKAARAPGRIYADLAATIAAALGLPIPTPGPDPEAWFRDAWLPAVLDGLPGGGPLAVLFDEFDVLADPKAHREASEAVFRSLRDLLDRLAPQLRFVFVIGRNVEDLSYLAGPLFKSLPSKQVSLLDRAETERVVLLSQKNGTLSWTGEAVEAAWALSHGHPYLLQHLCWQVWDAAFDASPAPPAVLAAGVEAAVPATLDASQNALEWLWGGLPPAARVVASALAKAGPGAISTEALQEVLRQSGVRVVLRELRDAPERLGEWDIVEPEGDGHRFRVELLRRWIVRYKPLGRVQQELDRIEPMAENLYRVAEGFFSTGEVEEALPPLRRALGFNPNHLRASELLAEILVSQGALEEARRVLEKLHENYPAAARSRLVDVLLQLAAGTDDEEGRLGLYAKVLGYDAGSTAAKEGECAVWLARGDRYRAEGEARAAVRSYRKAEREDLVEAVVEEERRRRLAEMEAGLAEMERQEHYDLALKVLGGRDEDTGEAVASLKDWSADIARFQRLAGMTGDYQRAAGALAGGDRAAAKALLVKVVAVDPDYKDAAKLLFEATSGVKVDALKAEVDAQRSAAQKADAGRRQIRRLAMVALGGGAAMAVSAVVVAILALRAAASLAIAPTPAASTPHTVLTAEPATSGSAVAPVPAAPSGSASAPPVQMAVDPLLVVPGTGINGVVVGKSTPDDVLRIYGNDCVVHKSEDGSVWAINYDWEGTEGRYNPERNRRRPYEFKFGAGVVSRISLGQYQEALHTAGGVTYGSLKTVVVKEFGSGFKQTSASQFNEVKYASAGILFMVNPDRDDVVFIYIIPPTR